MRKHSRSLLIYLIFGMLIAAFVISFGPQSGAARKTPGGGCGTGTPYVAKVNGREITETTWRYGILAMTGGRGATGDAARRAQVRERVLDELVVRELLAQTAEALGFRISEDEVRERIYDGDVYILGRRAPAKQMFWTQEEGDDAPKFRQKLFEQRAQSYGFQASERFVEELKRELLAQKVRELQLAAVRVSPEEVQRAYEREENKVDIEMVAFEPALLRDGIAVSAADIDAHLKDHEADLKAQYDKLPDRWKAHEKDVRVRDMFFKREVKKDAPPGKDSGPDAKARAAAAVAKVKRGADFGETAKALSEDDRWKKRGGDIGWRPLAGLRFGQPVIDAVGKLEVGQVSDVIETLDGFHIVQLIDVRQGDLAFDAVKREMAEDAIRDERAKAEAKRQADAALDKAKAGTPLDKQFSSDADAKGPRLQKLNDVERAGNRLPGIGESKELTTALFDETKPGDLLPKVYDVAGDYFVVRLAGRREPDMQKFQTEKAKLTAQMSQQRAQETLFWLQGVRCQEAKAQIQFDPSYVTYDETDDKGQTKRRLSYVPCMTFAAPGLLLQ
ncbi:MAG TPA: SurA N-terminal domain-containing protein [Haliangiales bacterium]|nr:SurA N-terminal domain-containing protein [Haliangiales bacterium]